MLDREHSVYLSVNRSGVTLWPLLVAGTTEEHLVEALVASFKLDRETAAADVQSFLTLLSEHSLLERD